MLKSMTLPKEMFRRIHSQVIGFGLSEGSGSDLAISVDELAKTLDELELVRSREARLEAEAMNKAELEAARAAEAESRGNWPGRGQTGAYSWRDQRSGSASSGGIGSASYSTRSVVECGALWMACCAA